MLARQRLIRTEKAMTRLIAIYGGSFDPPTFAHIKVATEIINAKFAHEVWVVPCGNRPDKDTNVPFNERFEMCKKAFTPEFTQFDSCITPEFPIKIMPTEKDGFIPTVHLMRKYRTDFPEYTFKMVIGSDLLTSLHEWDLYDKFKEETSFIVVPRYGYQINYAALADLTNYEILENSDWSEFVSALSSTNVRNRIKEDPQTAADCIPLPVLDFIESKGFYKPES
jgi:nicotinate-nucleotide adenylyltransferase